LMSMEGLHCVYTYPANSQLFFAPDGGNPKTRWPVQVWWCGPQENRVDTKESVHAAQTRLKVSVSAPAEYRQQYATEGATAPRIGEFIKQMRTAQGTDPFCKKQRTMLEEEPQAGRKFRMTAGLLWHMAEGRYQLVTPAQPATLRETTLRERRCKRIHQELPYLPVNKARQTSENGRAAFTYSTGPQVARSECRLCHRITYDTER
jgi:hypothetical protein